MRPKRLSVGVLALVALVVPLRVLAMPMFARRENVGCPTCHTVVPRLNRFGYEYRRAGFRVPDNLGKDEKDFNLGDFFSARVQASVDYAHADDAGGKPSDTFQLNFRESTAYPLTGSWGRHFSSMAEFSFAPEDFWEIENAYVRVNSGHPESFWHVRFGVFHPFEGYGASDRPVGVARPLFQTKPSNFNQSTFFTPWGFDQVGVEAGYMYKGFSATATVWNGISVREDDGAIKAFPAQGGELHKTAGAPASNYKDVQVFLNQFIGEHHGISAFYYHGWAALPRDPAMALDPPNLWRNSFDRFAVYGYTRPLRHLGFQVGAQGGLDHRLDTTTGSTDQTFTSIGAFGEVLVPINVFMMAAARYDFFDPSTSKRGNALHAVTAAINWYSIHGLQLIGEYRFIDTEQPAPSSGQREHTVQLRMIFIL